MLYSESNISPSIELINLADFESINFQNTSKNVTDDDVGAIDNHVPKNKSNCIIYGCMIFVLSVIYALIICGIIYAMIMLLEVDLESFILVSQIITLLVALILLTFFLLLIAGLMHAWLLKIAKWYENELAKMIIDVCMIMIYFIIFIVFIGLLVSCVRYICSQHGV